LLSSVGISHMGFHHLALAFALAGIVAGPPTARADAPPARDVVAIVPA
jgi:hypothetical protein